jgi:hydroxymethylpyrimidine/phosphomethylpyrimidine kinase
MKTVLTIAGSDSCGGAGIQADIKTITLHNLYATSVITALTAQNTTGVYGVAETSPEFVKQQIDCIFSDIRPDAVKIGMTASGKIIEVIAERLAYYHAENIVVDPVMVATSGSRLAPEEAKDALVARLFPLAAIITPNIPEAEVLCGFAIENEDDMLKAAVKLSGTLPGAILIKGGHLRDSANDLLFANGEHRWYSSERIDTANTHGTGCTLSSAIACGLARGFTLDESVKNAKEYVTGALAAGLRLGAGNGPLNHMWCLDKYSDRQATITQDC